MKIIEKIKQYIERNKTIRNIEIVILILLILTSVFSYIYGLTKINSDPGEIEYVKDLIMIRDESLEDYDEDSTICDVTYINEDKKLVISYPYQEYVNLQQKQINAYEYISEDGNNLIFDHKDPNRETIKNTYKETIAEKSMPIFNLANALIILSLSLLIILLFSHFFSTYEKCWFMTIMVLATIAAVIFPEESANGVNGIVIMLLYLLDTFFNILCELLISKQSRYNFLVSLLVEITEIAICLVLMYRFATMATTLFFWIPIDILSYINWTKHKDKKEDELTIVRKLKGYQEVLIIFAIAIWTFGVGYFISGLDISTDFLAGQDKLATTIIYIDACASAVGIANGLFIFFRLQEQWIAWYISTILETIINILSGQYVLLILKLGYLTNTTYGYIKWNNYIKTHKEESNSLF